MAGIPFYVLSGYLAEGSGTSNARDLTGGVGALIPTDWASHSLDPRYFFGLRRSGYGTGIPYHGAGTPPIVWNHDSFAGIPVLLASITAGAVTTLTLAVPHGQPIGTTREITVAGVTGADASKLNGSHVVTFTGPTTFTTPIDSSGLTFSATGATASVAGWSGLTGAVTEGIVNTHTDPSDRGANFPVTVTDPTAPGNIWGPIVSMAADLHDKNGPQGLPTRILQVGGGGNLLGRAPRRVTAVATGTVTEITMDGNIQALRMRLDPLRRQPVTFYGFTGDLAPLNGRHLVWFEGDELSSVLFVDVDTTGAAAYTSGAVGYCQPRWSVDADGEMLDELRDRLREVVASLTGSDDELDPRGILHGMSATDTSRAANNLDSQQGRYKALPVASVSGTGFPVRVTLTEPVALTQTTSNTRYGLVGRLNGASSTLGKLVDVRIISPTEIDLLTESFVPYSSGSGVTLDVGEPIRYYAEEFARTVRAVQDMVRDETGATELPPMALFAPWTKVEDDAGDLPGGTLKHADPEIRGEAERGIVQALSIERKIGQIRTDGREFGLVQSSSSIPNAESQIALGRITVERWDELQQDSVRTANGARPVYVLLGDSTCEGTVSYQALIQDQNAIFTAVPASIRSGEKIFDHASGQMQSYLPTLASFGSDSVPGNGNNHPVLNLTAQSPLPPLGTNVGPEVSLFYEMKQKHPESDVLFLKIGIPGSGLSVNASTRQIQSIEVTNDENGDPRVATIRLADTASHRRANVDRPFEVTLSAIPGITQGLGAGSYQAKGVGAATLEIRTDTNIVGTFSGSATVEIPNYRWRRADGDAWFYLAEAWGRMIAWACTEGIQLDVRGLFVQLGINDAIRGDVSTFEADATQFAGDLRKLFQTRSEPSPDLPIVWVKPRSNPDYTFSQSNVSTVQTAIQSVASADPAMGLFDPDTADDSDIEVNRFPLAVDGLHYTLTGTLELGKEMADTFSAIDNTGNETSAPEFGGSAGGAIEGTG